LRDYRDAEEVGEFEVVEADHGDGLPRLREDMQGEYGDAVVAAEDGGDRFRAAEHALQHPADARGGRCPIATQELSIRSPAADIADRYPR
jgi:hypothetical protein